MKARSLVIGTVLALVGWFALAPASTLKAASLSGYQVAQTEQHQREHTQERQWKGVRNDEWYQGQRGHWYKEGNRWQWRGAEKATSGTKGSEGTGTTMVSLTAGNFKAPTWSAIIMVLIAVMDAICRPTGRGR